MQHHRVARAEQPRGAHDRDRRAAAARVFRPGVERALQSVGVEARDAVDDDRVQRARRRRVVVVRQVGAGHEQRAPAAQHRAERVAEAPAVSAV